MRCTIHMLNALFMSRKQYKRRQKIKNTNAGRGKHKTRFPNAHQAPHIQKFQIKPYTLKNVSI